MKRLKDAVALSRLFPGRLLTITLLLLLCLPQAGCAQASDDYTPAAGPEGVLFGQEAPGMTPTVRSGTVASAAQTPWRIAFYSPRDGTDVRRLTSSPSTERHPAWSPDGSHIVFQSMRGGDFEIYAIDRDGGEWENETRNPAHDYWPTCAPAVRPPASDRALHLGRLLGN
jgi:hypothetical protein